MKVPRLRFKEFSGEWEVKKLGDLLRENLSNGEMTSKSDFVQSNGNFYLIQLNDLYESNIKMLVNKLQMIRFNENAKSVEVGDTIINRVSIKPEGVGKVTIVTSLPSDLKTTFESNMFRVRFSSEKLHQLYFAYFSLTKSYTKQKLALSKTTNQSSLSQADISFIGICFPTTSEQTKIANFLTAVDEKIAQLTQKNDLLARYKKGVMQQIFSQQLRFKDDDGREFPDWEATTLENCASFYRGGSLSKADIDVNGKYNCVHYGELFTIYNEVIKTIKSKTNITKTFKSEFGDILMPSSDVTPAGLARASCILKAGVVLGGDINIIRVKNTIAPIFISYLLNFEKNKIIQLVSGTTVKHIYIKDIKSIELSIPTAIAEQTKIANFLTALDDKITYNQTQLNALKQYKQGLLQQLFV
jgi:type I restriction enzyme S subunit